MPRDFSMKKSSIQELHQIVSNTDRSVLFKSFHDDSQQNPILLEAVKAWYDRVHHYFFKACYTLVNSNDYFTCREFIFFDHYKISNPNFDNHLKFEILDKNNQWNETQPSNQNWHINWSFQNLNFDYEACSNVCRNLIYNLAYKDCFDFDLRNQKNRSNNYYSDQHLKFDVPTKKALDARNQEIEYQENQNIMEFLILFVEHSHSYAPDIDFEKYSKKEVSKLKKPLANVRYIKQWHGTNTAKKINQIITRLIDKNYSSAHLVNSRYLSLSEYVQAVGKYSPVMDSLLEWKAESKSKFIISTNLIDQNEIDAVKNKNLFSYDNMDFFLKNSNDKLVGKACFKVFLNLNPTTLKSIIYLLNSYGSKAQLGKFFLYWRTQSKHKKVKAWVCEAILGIQLGNMIDLSKPNADAMAKKLVICFDLIYTALDKIWTLAKKKTLFFDLVRNSDSFNGMIDYLFTYTPNATLASNTNNLNCYRNIKHLTSKSTHESIVKKVEEWHLLAKQLEVGDLKQYEYPRINRTVNEVEFEVIHTNHECAEESLEMHHCILTFNDRMLNRSYIAFRVNGFDERATLGAWIEHYEDHAHVKFNQCYGHYNKRMPNNIISACHALIEKINHEKLIMSNNLTALQESIQDHEKLFKLEYTPELNEIDLAMNDVNENIEEYMFF